VPLSYPPPDEEEEDAAEEAIRLRRDALMPYLLRERLFPWPAFEISGTVETPLTLTVRVGNGPHDTAYDDLLEKLYDFVVLVLQPNFTLLLNDDDIADVRDIIKRLLCVNAINPDLVKVIFQYLQPFVSWFAGGDAPDAPPGGEIQTLVSSLLPSSVHGGYDARALARAVIHTKRIIEAGGHGTIFRLWWLSRPIPGLRWPKWNRVWFEPPDDGDLTREQIDAQIASGEWQLTPLVRDLFLSNATSPLTCDQWNAIINAFVELHKPLNIERQTDTVPADFPDGEGDAFFVHFGEQFCLIALRRKGRCLFLSDSFEATDFGLTEPDTCPMARFVPNSTVTFSPDGERIEIANLSWHVGMVGQHLQTRPMNIPFYAAREDRFRRGCAILGLLHTFFAWNAFDTSVMPESTNCRQDNNMDVFTGAKDYPASRCWCAHVWDAYTHQDTEVLRLRLVKFLLDIGDGDEDAAMENDSSEAMQDEPDDALRLMG